MDKTTETEFFRKNSLADFQTELLAWYDACARKLPWRDNPTPYRVWVSEIMLQQTTTTTVQGYFDRFMAAFPNVQTLAEAQEGQVLKLWEGLGYYRRARQLHKAAQTIVRDFNGLFPATVETIQTLPGVGRYTAGAIASIACGRKAPILEANTIRLYSRLAAWPHSVHTSASNQFLWSFAERILPDNNAGLFNQALMDLGSQICRPNSPRCLDCPVSPFCVAFRNHQQDTLPVMPPREEKEPRTEVAMAVSLADWTGRAADANRYLFLRTPPSHRWAGLWDFPRFLKTNSNDIPNDRDLARKVATLLEVSSCLVHAPQKKISHVVTRFRITLNFCRCTVQISQRAKRLPKSEPRLMNNAARMIHLAAGQGPACDLEFRWLTPQEAKLLPLNSTAIRLLALLDQP
ncbi:MAG: A/G-specific adenine glycosylase [Planctomycetia bacterium]|nr:A/G-specific adenine glycosylase [Planctomycetia bacterium]